MRLWLLLGLVAAGLWWLRQRPPVVKPPQRRVAPPQEMVACRHCAMHLPATEAVTGQLGAYCCEQHRQLAEP
jgi:uncharacterized protein